MDWEKVLLPYKQAADEIKSKLDNVSLQLNKLDYSSPIFLVEARVKKIPSILAKAQRKKIPMENIRKEMRISPVFV
jgi:putative GTP pyrophosphokinase